MKTERRHELQHNDLSDWLGDWIVSIVPYAKAILGVGILLAVAGAVWSYVSSRGEQREREAWTAYFDAFDGGDPDGFKTVLDTYPSTVAAQWATQAAGEVHLNTGLRQLFTDRDKAKEEFTKARAAYEKIVESATDPMLRIRAYYGLAQCQESQGEFAAAEESYGQVVKSATDPALAKLAQQRIDRLKQPATKDWYAWFAEQKPVKSPLQDPGLFQDLPQLPDKPNLNVPQPGQLLPPGSNESSTETSSLPTLPSTGDAPNGVDATVPATTTAPEATNSAPAAESTTTETPPSTTTP